MTVRIVNGTGVLVHGHFGRAVLSPAARAAVDTAAGCADFEYDLEAGRHDRRGRATYAALRRAVPAAGDVLVVNNNAAALVLAVTALAAGREVVISRGELMESGDGFHLPDLLSATGARVHEVGSTNRTTLTDYRRALWSGTGAILKVYPSTYRIDGLTAQVGVDQLARLGVPVITDVGNGLLAPHPLLTGEPDVDTVLRQGAALATASGDKLLGGPQSGLLLGMRATVDQVRRHPLGRAMRPDKLTLAALEATVRGGPTPTMTALEAPLDELRERGRAVLAALQAGGVAATLVPAESTVREGRVPGARIPSVAVSLSQRLSRPLRRGVPAVVGRIRDGRLQLDLRSVPPEQDAALVAAVIAGAAGLPDPGAGNP